MHTLRGRSLEGCLQLLTDIQLQSGGHASNKWADSQIWQADRLLRLEIPWQGKVP